METGRARDIEVEIKGPETTEIEVNFGDKVEAVISVPVRKTKKDGKGSKSSKSSQNTKVSKMAKSIDIKNTKAKADDKNRDSKSNKVESPRRQAIKQKALVEAKQNPPKKRWKKCVALATILIFVVAVLLMATLGVFWWCKAGPSEEIEITFSKKTGLYTDSQEIELATSDAIISPVTMIKYTLDGDDPETAGVVYDGPIRLELLENVKVYPVKAAYCYIGGRCGKVFSETYILTDNPEEDITLDIISITSDHDGLYDYEKGILTRGKVYDESKAKLEGTDDYIWGNYNMRTDEWIRDAQVVRIDPEGEVLWNQDIGIQVSGKTVVTAPVKALKLVANEKYGYSKLAYDFGESGSSTTGLNVVKKYNSLRLSAGGQDRDKANIRSSVTSRLAEESGFDGYSATKRAVAYLNGEYYGIMNMQQNYSDSFLKKRFGLSNSDAIEKIKGAEVEVFEAAGVSGLFEEDLEQEENRKKLEESIDMDSYLKYYAIQILWNNVDWPGNNFEIWRYIGGENPDNRYSDGKWRFLIYDTDLVWGNETFYVSDKKDHLASLMEGEYSGEGSTFKKVIESSYYRNKFLQIVEELREGPFKTGNIIEIIDEEAEKIAPAMQLYSDEEGYEDWEGWVRLLKDAVYESQEMLASGFYKYFKVVL